MRFLPFLSFSTHKKTSKKKSRLPLVLDRSFRGTVPLYICNTYTFTHMCINFDDPLSEFEALIRHYNTLHGFSWILCNLRSLLTRLFLLKHLIINMQRQKFEYYYNKWGNNSSALRCTVHKRERIFFFYIYILSHLI